MSPITQFQVETVRPAPGRTLVVGSRIYPTRTDRRKLFGDDGAIGVDLVEAEGVDVVLDFEEPLPLTLGTFAHVDCVSVLEHSRRPWLMAANIELVLRPGGTLYVQVPLVWWDHRPPDYWRMTVEGVRSIFPRIAWKRLSYAHIALVEDGKMPAIKRDGHRYIARTEVCGFGTRQ